MNWGNPIALYALLIVPILVGLLFINKHARKRQLLKFADEKLLSFHQTSYSSFYFNLKTFLLISALSLVIIGIARPQWDPEVHDVVVFGQDIVFLLDVSKSMDADDIAPSRLERARVHIQLFLDRLAGDRVALVAFAGDAIVICPLTTDKGSFRLFLSGVNTSTITDLGTDIGRGLEVAAQLFDETATAKTIIMLTDGEDHEERGLYQAQLLAEKGVVVYTIGFGTQEGTVLFVSGPGGRQEIGRDDQGNPVVTRLDVPGLQEIAQVTRGRFFNITPWHDEIDQIINEIRENELTEHATRQVFRYREQFHFFLLFALLLLIIEGYINYRSKGLVVRD
jgi:Ca-activated chloride channel family protein